MTFNRLCHYIVLLPSMWTMTTYVSFYFLHIQPLCQEFDAYTTMVLVAMYRHQGVLCRTVKKLRAFGIVYENKGGMVPGLANRNGHRDVAEGRNKAGWGGVWIENLLIAEISRWLHADAVSAKNIRTTNILVQIAEEYNNSSDEELSDNE